MSKHANPEAEKPEPTKPAKKKLKGAERFKDEFTLKGSLQPLQWKPGSGSTYRIQSEHGFLCYTDGEEVVLTDIIEASELVSELTAIRPLDKIQLHTS